MQFGKGYVFLHILDLFVAQEVDSHEGLVRIRQAPQVGVHIVAGEDVFFVIGG